MEPDRFLPPHSVDSTSKDLINRLKLRNPDSWDFLIKIYGPIVSWWARNARMTAEEIQDVTQEVFLAVARKIDQFEREDGKAKFRSWLKTITRNKINDHFRKIGKDQLSLETHRIPPNLTLEPANQFDEELLELSDQENAAIVQSVLRTIQDEFEDKTWQCFWRTAIDDDRATDIAQELGLSAEAIRKNKSRILKRLREVLLAYFG